MENLPTAAATTTVPPRRYPLFLVGAFLLLLGPAIYAVQIGLKHLQTPWYVPILATVGVLFMALSVWQRRGLGRSVGLVLGVLVCAFLWFFVVGTKTPTYEGPAQAGSVVPAFATTLADGTSFTNENLQKGTPTALIFFRGRW